VIEPPVESAQLQIVPKYSSTANHILPEFPIMELMMKLRVNAPITAARTIFRIRM
jgi:hypothetical protein